MKDSIIRKSLIILFWLICWEVIALIIDNNIVLVGPIEVIKSLIDGLFDKQLWVCIFNSTISIVAGFIASGLLAMILGVLSYRYEIVKELFSPVCSVLKVIPVASFVVLLLIWVGSSNLAFFISFLIVFPQIYISVISGLDSTDKAILKMAKAFEYSWYEKAVYIYKDACMPYLISAFKASYGLAWKSGVAAEVIGMSANCLGHKIYTSKIYLDTASLFAYTLIVILLSFSTEKLFLFLLNRYSKVRKNITKQNKAISTDERELLSDNDIDLKNICFSYQDRQVLNDESILLKQDLVYLLSGPSGIGKTTLLKEIYKRTDIKKSVVFQEDRLLEEYNGMTNILLGNRHISYDEAKKIAKLVLDESDLLRPVKEYSGGMKRRIAILRALLKSSGLIIMDEPFSGLDDDMKIKVIDLIKSYRRGRILLVVSHDKEDAKYLDANMLYLN